MRRLHINQPNKPVGKLGNRVYYFVGEDYRSRTYVIPVQPRTGQQKAHWRRLTNGVKDWKKLSIAIQEAWNIKAIPYRMSGFNKFISERLLS